MQDINQDINQDRKNYKRNIDVATAAALVFCILSFRIAAEFDLVETVEQDIEFTRVELENVPITRQGKRKPPPQKPAIPVPAEDDEIPEDETIEPTEWDLFADNGEDGSGAFSDEGAGAPVITPPRPIAWVIPEFPEKEKKRGVHGEVKVSAEINERGRVVDAVVLENSTGSEVCAAAAVRAVKASRFIPAKKNGVPTTHFLTLPIRFDLSK